MSVPRLIDVTDLIAFLEHDGTINDEEGIHYLQQMADAGVCATFDDPVVLGLTNEQDQLLASIYDGNHRLILAHEFYHDSKVPVSIQWVESSFPGVPYDGRLGMPS